jgi:hypothetical protein
MGENLQEMLAAMSPDKKTLSVFSSLLPRDNLASVSRDAVASPGPGTYVALED